MTQCGAMKSPRQVKVPLRSAAATCATLQGDERSSRMFLILLLVTFAIAAVCSFIVVRLFERPIGAILRRIISDDLGNAWLRYLKFATYVVGISGGVRIWELEKYINPLMYEKDSVPLTLNASRWTLEVYRTVISTMQSTAWMLLVFFVCALIAYVVVRGFELRRQGPTQKPG
jgi:hypothetical protein